MLKQLLPEGIGVSFYCLPSSPLEKQSLHLRQSACWDLWWVTPAHLHWPDRGDAPAGMAVWRPEDGAMSESNMGRSGMTAHARAGGEGKMHTGEYRSRWDPFLCRRTPQLPSLFRGESAPRPLRPWYGVITERNRISESGTPHLHWRSAVKRRGAARERALLDARPRGSRLTHARRDDHSKREGQHGVRLNDIHKQVVFNSNTETNYEISASEVLAVTLSGGHRWAQSTSTSVPWKGMRRDLLRARAARRWRRPPRQKLLVMKTQRRCLQRSVDPLRRQIPSRAVWKSTGARVWVPAARLVVSSRSSSPAAARKKFPLSALPLS
jgi:hypothetical protein